jgi:hypothetical protein
MLMFLFNRLESQAAPISVTPIQQDRSKWHSELA